MSTIFTCAHNLGAMLTCIYDAWSSGLGHQNIRLMFEPVEEFTFLDKYIHVDEDPSKIQSVIDAVNRKISPYVYSEIAYAAGAYEPDTLDTIYRVLILGFHYGPKVLEMYQFKDVTRFFEIRRRYGREADSFLEFVRFNYVNSSVYVAHIEPKSYVLLPVAEHFIDRMPSENWIIIDDVHKEAIVHPSNSPYYLRYLTEEEYLHLLETEKSEDIYTSMWRSYFEHIAIEARKNRQCQLNHFPEWKRKHAHEFTGSAN